MNANLAADRSVAVNKSAAHLYRVDALKCSRSLVQVCTTHYFFSNRLFSYLLVWFVGWLGILETRWSWWLGANFITNFEKFLPDINRFYLLNKHLLISLSFLFQVSKISNAITTRIFEPGQATYNTYTRHGPSRLALSSPSARSL